MHGSSLALTGCSCYQNCMPPRCKAAGHQRILDLLDALKMYSGCLTLLICACCLQCVP